MKKIKLLSVLICMMVIFIASRSQVYAVRSVQLAFWNGRVGSSGPAYSCFEYIGSAGGASNTGCKYGLEGIGTVFCVEPSVDYESGENYEEENNIPLSREVACEISYIIYMHENDKIEQTYSGQYCQAAVWCLADPDGRLRTFDPNDDANYLDGDISYVRRLVQMAQDAYDPERDAVFADGYKFNPCIVYNVKYPSGGGPCQRVAITSYEECRTGNLKVEKREDKTQNGYDDTKAGAKFEIYDPNGDLYATWTSSNTETSHTYTDLEEGTWTIKEIYAPTNMYITTRKIEATIKGGKTTSIAYKNKYQRGTLKVIKKDVFKDLGKKNYGDGTLAGTIVNLYAAEQIKEGNHEVLNANELVASKTIAYDETNDEFFAEISGFTNERTGITYDKLPIGKYYWVEATPSSSYLNYDEATVPEAKVEKHYVEIKADTVNKESSLGKSEVATILEQEIYGGLSVYKMDNNNNNMGENSTEKNCAYGAKLALVLASNYDRNTKKAIDTTHDYYETTIDENGYGKFENIEFEQKFKDTGISMEYTIPYGDYILYELEASEDGGHYFYGIQHQPTPIKVNNFTEQKIVSDEPVPFELEIVKKDKDTQKTVAISGAKFKLWDCNANCFITQRIPLSDKSTDELTTNNQGHLVFPERLYAGTYVIYEIESPDGYYLNDEYRIPLKADGQIDYNRVGNDETVGIYLNVTIEDLNLTYVEQYPINERITVEYLVDHLLYTINVADNPLKAQIKLYKHGLKYTDVKQETDNLKNKIYEETQPVYTDVPMYGAKFRVTAVEDIYSKDGNTLYVNAGRFWDYETNNDGLIETEELYLGKYKVEEIVTPLGFETVEPFEVVLENTDKKNRVKEYYFDIKNEYQQVDVSVNKEFKKNAKDSNLLYKVEGEDDSKDEEGLYAVLGIYANEDLNNIYETQTIRKDTLIEAVVVKKDETVYLDAWLPDGKYYVKELEVSETYILDDEKHYFEVKHSESDHTSKKIKIDIAKITNWPLTTELHIAKVSNPSVVLSVNAPLITKEKNEEFIKDILATRSKEIARKYSAGTISLTEAVNEIKSLGIKMLGGAEYEVFADPDCKKHLQVSKDNGVTYENVILTSQEVTNEAGESIKLGLYSLVGIPERTYYIRETKAPDFIDEFGTRRVYQKDLKVLEIDTFNENINDKSKKSTFKIFGDNANETTIEKLDIFTGETVPDCLFRIDELDEETGEIKYIGEFLTDEFGKAGMPADTFLDGKTYYFTETKASVEWYYDGKDLYKLNKEPHEFIAHIDENGNLSFTSIVENEDGTKKEVKKDKIYNYRTKGELEIQKLDAMDSTVVPNCKFELRSLETNWSKVGITDENGIYIFKDLPYGDYVYTEIEAPEGYDIDTTPHYITIDVEKTRVVVKDVRTGDIDIYTISGIGLVCMLGIVFVIVKNTKRKMI